MASEELRAHIGGAAALRFDLIGVLSVVGDDQGRQDVRLRVAGQFSDREQADLMAGEVSSLYTCGPAGGGGVRTTLRRRLETRSCFVHRNSIIAFLPESIAAAPRPRLMPASAPEPPCSTT